MGKRETAYVLFYVPLIINFIFIWPPISQTGIGSATDACGGIKDRNECDAFGQPCVTWTGRNCSISKGTYDLYEPDEAGYIPEGDPGYPAFKPMCVWKKSVCVQDKNWYKTNDEKRNALAICKVTERWIDTGEMGQFATISLLLPIMGIFATAGALYQASYIFNPKNPMSEMELRDTCGGYEGLVRLHRIIVGCLAVWYLVQAFMIGGYAGALTNPETGCLRSYDEETDGYPPWIEEPPTKFDTEYISGMGVTGILYLGAIFQGLSGLGLGAYLAYHVIFYEEVVSGIDIMPVGSEFSLKNVGRQKRAFT